MKNISAKLLCAFILSSSLLAACSGPATMQKQGSKPAVITAGVDANTPVKPLPYAPAAAAQPATTAQAQLPATLPVTVHAPSTAIPSYANLLPATTGQTATVLRVRTAGDTMLGNIAAEKMPDGNPLLPVLDLLSDADYSFLNLEGPVCDIEGIESKCDRREREILEGRRKAVEESKCYVFRSPSVCVDYLARAGVDAVSLSNNHLFDFDVDCATNTVRILKERGIKPFGFKQNTAAPDNTTLAEAKVNGYTITLAGFNFSASGGYLLPVQEVARAEKLVREARKKSHFVFVMFHAGAEGAENSRVPDGTEFYFKENRGDVKKFARAMVDAGAALVVGHSPHVLRGVELYKGRLIAYSLGNFATYAGFSLNSPNNLGAVLEAALDEKGRLTYGTVFSTIQSYATCNAKPCTKLMPDPQNRALKRIQQLSMADFPKSALKIGDGKYIPLPAVKAKPKTKAKAGAKTKATAKAVRARKPAQKKRPAKGQAR